MPMGPFILMDTIGLDVLADVSEHLRSRTGREPLHAAVLRLVVGGDFGKKSGRGFYRWDGARVPNRSVGFPDEPKQGFMPLPREIVGAADRRDGARGAAPRSRTGSCRSRRKSTSPRSSASGSRRSAAARCATPRRRGSSEGEARPGQPASAGHEPEAAPVRTGTP